MVADSSVSTTAALRQRRQERPTRKGIDTRRRILDAAKIIFERDGFVEARVADIVDVAGTSYGSFYTYFDTKETIFRMVGDDILLEIHNAFLDLVEGDPSQTEQSAALLYDLWSEHRNLMLAYEQAAAINPEFMEKSLELRATFVLRYAKVIDRLKAEGKVYKDVNSQYAAAVIGSMIEMSMRAWVAREEPHDKTLALKTLASVWERGIGLRRDRTSGG